MPLRAPTPPNWQPPNTSDVIVDALTELAGFGVIYLFPEAGAFRLFAAEAGLAQIGSFFKKLFDPTTTELKGLDEHFRREISTVLQAGTEVQQFTAINDHVAGALQAWKPHCPCPCTKSSATGTPSLDSLAAVLPLLTTLASQTNLRVENFTSSVATTSHARRPDGGRDVTIRIGGISLSPNSTAQP